MICILTTATNALTFYIEIIKLFYNTNMQVIKDYAKYYNSIDDVKFRKRFEL